MNTNEGLYIYSVSCLQGIAPKNLGLWNLYRVLDKDLLLSAGFSQMFVDCQMHQKLQKMFQKWKAGKAQKQ